MNREAETNQTGLELKYNVISAIFLILSLHFSVSHLSWSWAGLPLWKGSFCSCHCPVIWILTPSLSHWWLNLLMQSACLKNQWGVLWAPSPLLSLTKAPPLSTKQFHPQPIGKRTAVHSTPFLKGSSKTFRLWMDEKRWNIWEGLMNLTYKLSIMIWLFPHRYKLYLWIYSWTNTAQSAR